MEKKQEIYLSDKKRLLARLDRREKGRERE
jgi:hypothetical protein